MSGPWEKYQKPESDSGPWAQYQKERGKTPLVSRQEMRARFSQSPNLGALTDTLKDVPGLIGQGAYQTLQGFMDLPVGAAQLVSKVLPQSVEDAVSSYMSEREQQYAPLTGALERPSEIQPGRIGGSAAFGIGLAPTRAGSLWETMKSGAKLGTTIGAASPVDPNNPNFWPTKTLQTVTGAAAGFVAPPVVEGVVRGTSSAINALARNLKGTAVAATGAAKASTVESTLQIEFQRSGVDWSKLSKEARDGIVVEVQKALKSGGTLDDEAIKRLADFTRLGITPTKGQVTRDPGQFAFERNIGKTDMGAELAQRFNTQNAQLIGSLDKTRAGTGGVGTDPYATGQMSISALKATDAPRKAAVDSAYELARQQSGEGSAVPMQPVAQRLGQIIEDFGDDKIPGAVMKRLNQFGLMGNVQSGMHGGIAISGNQTKLFTVRDAEKLRTLISNNIDPANRPQMAALSRLRESVDDAINAMADKGDDIGAAAAAQFGRARGLAAERFKTIKNTPALADVLDPTKQVPPEKFVSNYILRGSIDDVTNLAKELRKTPEAYNEARAQVIQWLRDRAVGGSPDELAQFSQAAYNRAMFNLGDRKLGLLFSKEEQQALKAVGRVAGYIQKAPTSSGVNYSGSATTLIDAMDKITRFPLIGALLGKPGDIIRASQTASALGPAAPVRPMDPLLQQEMVNRMGRYGGMASAPASAAVLPGTLTGR